MRFHLTPEGPKRCTVDESNPNSTGCKYGEHYPTLKQAEKRFEKIMEKDKVSTVTATPSKVKTVKRLSQGDKTKLRETSFSVFASAIAHGEEIDIDSIQSGEDFLKIADMYLPEADIDASSSLNKYNSMSKGMKDILNNGLELARGVANDPHFNLRENKKARWIGREPDSDPLDAVIGDYGFSLKEDSFILKNMSVANFLKNMTGENHEKGRRGLHVFKEFAGPELDRWMKYSWGEFEKHLEREGEWSFANGVNNRNTATARIDGDYIILDYNGRSSRVPRQLNSEEDYYSLTTSTTREKVFSRWLNLKLQNDPTYVDLKKKTSVAAGKRIVEQVRKSSTPKDARSFLGFEEESYYYGKVDGKTAEAYRVPSIHDIGEDKFEFVDIDYSVPKSQLNIETKFRNTETGELITFRNEARYSHGQLNGTPEAKMYVDKSTSMNAVYEHIFTNKIN